MRGANPRHLILKNIMKEIQYILDKDGECFTPCPFAQEVEVSFFKDIPNVHSSLCMECKYYKGDYGFDTIACNNPNEIVTDINPLKINEI